MYFTEKTLEMSHCCTAISNGSVTFANVNHQDDVRGCALLYWAISVNHENCVRRLVSIGANVNLKSRNGLTPLHSACMNGCSLEFLIRSGANVNERDANGDTPLHYASFNNSVENIRILVSNGARLGEKNIRGETPLHIACNSYHLEAVESLVRYGANINEQDNNGMTPLHIAAENSSLEIMKFLIGSSADCTIKSGKRKYLDLVEVDLRDEIVSFQKERDDDELLTIKEPCID